MKMEDIEHIDVSIHMIGKSGRVTTVSKTFRHPISLVFDQQLEQVPGDDPWLHRRPTGYQTIKISGYVEDTSSLK
jgi:hypothetical protein